MNKKQLQRQTLINLLSVKGLFYQECKRRYINHSNTARTTSRINDSKGKKEGTDSGRVRMIKI
jgi:hypothetical protein